MTGRVACEQADLRAVSGQPPLRVAVLGAGTIARVHVANLAQIPEARLVAVADSDRQRAAALAIPAGAACAGDVGELLERHSPDAVIICLPPFATPGVVGQLAAHGVHVYAEKPVALELSSALADLATVRRAGVVAASGYMWRASPVVAAAREYLLGRTVGLIQGTVITAAPPPAWWGDKRRSGGALVELATHVVDLVRLFGGEPRRVTCVGARTLLAAEPGTVEDCLAATIAFSDGAIGSLAVTCGTTGGRWGVDVVARDLHLALDFFPERLTGTDAGRPIDVREVTPAGVTSHGFSGAGSWYRSLDRFLRAVRDGAPGDVASTFEDGVRTLALTLACEQSRDEGGAPVAVPTVP